MNVASFIPTSWVKSIIIAIVGIAAGFGSKTIIGQQGKVYDLGYGAKIVITQEIVDKGTNAVEIVKQKAIAAIESGFSK